jgi:hypothetical protein
MSDITVPAADTGLPTTMNRRSALAKLGLGLAASTSLAATAIAAPAGVSPELLRLIEAHKAAWEALGLVNDDDRQECTRACDAECDAIHALCSYRCGTIAEMSVRAGYLLSFGLSDISERNIEALLQSVCAEA